MSIEDEILDRVERGMLHPLLPSAVGDAPIRAMFVAEKLWAFLHSHDVDQRRLGELQADLEVFVSQKIITPKYLFLLSPAGDGVWEIRSVRGNPSIRVVGMFAAFDTYIAVDVATREELGGWDSQAWKQFKRNARAVWRQLFGSFEPVITADVGKVVSGAIDGRYLK
jgi:hypothetical protein